MPPMSALYPPSDGMTSPPAALSAAISSRYRPALTGCDGSPFQASVHESFDRVSRKASVKCLMPEAAATVASESFVYVWK